MNYYVATTGSDYSGDGSAGNPWASLYKASIEVSGAGDIIYIAIGNYTENHKCYIAPNVSIYGYGNGTKITSGYEGTNDRGDALIVFENGSNTSQVISNLWLDGNNEYGFSAIAVYNRSNVEISNLQITDFYYHGVAFSGGSASGNKIHDCTIDNCAMQSDVEVGALIWMSHNTGLEVYNNYLTQNTRSSGTNDEGECLTGGDYLYGTKIYGNYLNNIRTGETKSCYWPFAVEFWSNQHYTGTGLGTEIYDNTFIGEVDFGSGLSKGAYDYSLYIHDNTFGSGTPEGESVLRNGLQMEEYLYDVIIENNIFQGINKPIYFCAQTSSDVFDNIYIVGNQFINVRFAWDAHNNPYDPVEGTTNGCAIDFGSPTRPAHVDNIYVWNNTFRAYSSAPGDCAIYLPTSGDCDNFEIKNNIVVGFTDAPFIAERTTVGGTLDTLTLDNNILYNNGNSNDLLLQAGFVPTNVTDDGGIKSDPLLTSSTDFHLQAGSPGIGAGVNVSYPIATWDHYDVAWGSPPSIGAVEDGETGIPPVPVTGLSLNCTSPVPEISVQGGTYQFIPTITPGNATNKSLYWEVILDTGVGSVSQTGLVTAHSNGYITVRATTLDGSLISDECQVLISGQEEHEYVETHNIANAGWRIPTSDDVEELANYLGGELVAGTPLREVGTDHWCPGNTGTDTVAFTFLGTGYRGPDGIFYELGSFGGFWVYDLESGEYGIAFTYSNLDELTIYLDPSLRGFGVAVRLIKEDDIDPGYYQDYDGNVYPTRKIGNQVWTGADLRVTHFSDGTPIAEVQNAVDWQNADYPAWCWYENIPDVEGVPFQCPM